MNLVFLLVKKINILWLKNSVFLIFYIISYIWILGILLFCMVIFACLEGGEGWVALHWYRIPSEDDHFRWLSFILTIIKIGRSFAMVECWSWRWLNVDLDDGWMLILTIIKIGRSFAMIECRSSQYDHLRWLNVDLTVWWDRTIPWGPCACSCPRHTSLEVPGAYRRRRSWTCRSRP